MANRALISRFSLILLFLLGVAACAPPSSLPAGPTPIPTLIPVTETVSLPEPTAEPSPAILSYPAREPSAASGQEIYAAMCAECHGVDGAGTVPAARNFRDLDYMRAETPADFYVTVAEGRGEMPGYTDTLSSDERWDVVFYVWRLSTSTEVLEVGEQVYGQNCVSCHGEGGAGEVLGSSDFTDLRFMAELAPRDLFLTITEGRGSMPAWQSLLSQDERWAVTDYIRSFTYDPTLPDEIGPAPATEGPPTEPPGPAACSPDQAPPFAWDEAPVIQAGSELYQAQCSFCHGPDASGGLPGTPDYTSPEVGADLNQNPGVSFCTLTEGKGAMPAFGETLTDEERWQVLIFLGSLTP